MSNAPRLKTVATDVLLTQVSELLRGGHVVTIVVRGNSMNPFLVDQRDRVSLISCPPGRPKVGDFVLAYEASADRYVTHRVLRCLADGGFLLMGDGNVRSVERIRRGDVIGLVSAVERKGRRYSTASLPWRIYSALWVACRPLRRWLLAVWRRL